MILDILIIALLGYLYYSGEMNIQTNGKKFHKDSRTIKFYRVEDKNDNIDN